MKKSKTALLSATMILFPLLSFSPVAVAKDHTNYRHDRDVIKNWKSYYKGTPSFKLRQDPQLKRYAEFVEQAEKNVKEGKANLKPFEDIIEAENKAISERKKRNGVIDKETLKKTKTRITLANQVKSLEGAIKVTTDETKKAELQTKLDAAQKSLNEVDAALTALVAEKEENKKKNKASKNKIAQANTEAELQRKILAKFERGLEKAVKRKIEYKRNLIVDILDKNRDGSRRGHIHAKDDADELAIELGELYGVRDGSRDGEYDGIAAGKDRVRGEATSEGQRVGAEQALADGTETGRNEGLRDGNINRGRQDGRARGLVQAQNSDAKAKGTELGRAQGTKQAQIDGNRDGLNLGEAQAISKNESAKLTIKSIDGNFVGAFSRKVPGYPDSRSRGGRYNNRATYKLAILKEAYKDGYHYTYNRTHRRHFNERIEIVYEGFYARQYDRNFELFERQDYPSVRQVSFESSRTDTYNRDYPRHRSAARDKYTEIAFNNPDTAGEVYRGSFENARSEAYSVEYSSIKESARANAKDQTYKTRYPVEKEIARKNAFSATENTYQTSSVLKLESVDVIDAGIKKVGAQDGIVQPNENKTYTIKITNYGSVAKKDVKVIVNGVAFNLGTVPAKTIATIKAAAKSKVSGTLNSRDRDQVVVVSTARNKIEARHFASAKDGILSSQTIDNGVVQYPLDLTHLSLGGELLRGKAVGLRARVSNKSTKSYSGVKVVLESDTDGVIKKEFANLNDFKGAKTISDAVVSVTNKNETYTPISISAYLEKDGVIVGDASRALNTYAKEAYDKSKKTVIVVDSHDSLRAAKDLINKTGGLEKVAILDTSVRSANNSALASGLKDKALVISSNGNVINKVRETIKKSQDIALVALGSSTFQKLTDLSDIYKKNTYIEFNLGNRNNKTAMRFANPRLNKAVKSSLPIISANRDNFSKELAVAKVMSQSNDSLIKELNSKINEGNFFNGNKEIESLVEGGTIKAMDDILKVNKEYDESVKVFGDKKIAEKIKSDKSLFHNKLNTALGSKAKSSNLGLYMFASEAVNSIKEGLKEKKDYKKIMRETIYKRLFTYKKGIFGKKRKGPLSEVENKLGSISKVSKSVSSKLKSSKGQFRTYKLD
jgi:hypothetical protein